MFNKGQIKKTVRAWERRAILKKGKIRNFI